MVAVGHVKSRRAFCELVSPFNLTTQSQVNTDVFFLQLKDHKKGLCSMFFCFNSENCGLFLHILYHNLFTCLLSLTFSRLYTLYLIKISSGGSSCKHYRRLEEAKGLQQTCTEMVCPGYSGLSVLHRGSCSQSHQILRPFPREK